MRPRGGGATLRSWVRANAQQYAESARLEGAGRATVSGRGRGGLVVPENQNGTPAHAVRAGEARPEVPETTVRRRRFGRGRGGERPRGGVESIRGIPRRGKAPDA